MYSYRPYQQEAIAAVMDALIEDHKSILLTACTGVGKTVIASGLIDIFVKVYKYRVLFIAPRKELIDGAFFTIRDTLCLENDYDVEIEMGDRRFDNRAWVVVGSRQTCHRANRLTLWTPDVIMVDECDEAACASQQAIFDRFPNALQIGMTATAMRGDNIPVYHLGIDDVPVKVYDRKSGNPRDSKPEECVFHKHVFDYPLTDAVQDGYLVPPIGYKQDTKVDISGVDTNTGDFVSSQLQGTLEATDEVISERINSAIGAWKEVAEDRPTVVFCPSVKYAHWSAKLWQEAGYTSQAISGETDDRERDLAIPNIREGKAHVTCNFGIYTKGTDVDLWGCAVMMRPTKSGGLYSQMIGRVTRPHGSIAGMLGHIPEAQDRRDLILRSPKPSCIIIDMVDICGKHKVSTLPSVLGKPRKIDMQGHTLLEVEKLVRELEEKKVVIDYNCPVSFRQLERRLEEIQILEGIDPRSRDRWMLGSDGGYSYGKAHPKYGAKLLREEGGWRLLVHHEGEIIYDRVGTQKGSVSDYFDTASQVAVNQMKIHQRDNPKETNAMAVLTSKQLYHLRRAYTDREISTMQLGWARMEVGRLAKEWGDRVK